MASSASPPPTDTRSMPAHSWKGDVRIRSLSSSSCRASSSCIFSRSIAARSLPLAPGLDEILELDPEPVGDPGYVVEERDYLNRVVDGSVREAEPAELFDVAVRHPFLLASELRGELAQGPVNRLQRSAPPIAGYRVHEPVGFLLVNPLDGLDTEVVCVRLYSVVTFELGGRHRREQ